MSPCGASVDRGQWVSRDSPVAEDTCTDVISISESADGKELSSCSVPGCRSALNGSWIESVSGRAVLNSLCIFFNPWLGVELDPVADPDRTAIVRGVSEER